uniref:Uncharacterized protein n=1 Tax=Sphaerodactylus townsendi TaxID=933632 RepID=A0ACB8FE38_9SAUR
MKTYPAVPALPGIIQKIVDSHKVKNVACFGLRLSHLQSEDVHWLHPDMGVSNVREKFELAHAPEEWNEGAFLGFENDNNCSLDEEEEPAVSKTASDRLDPPIEEQRKHGNSTQKHFLALTSQLKRSPSWALGLGGI